MLFPSDAVVAQSEQEAGNNRLVVAAVVVHRCNHIGIAVGKGEPKAGVEGSYWRFVEDNVHRNPSYSRFHIAYKLGEEWPLELVE